MKLIKTAVIGVGYLGQHHARVLYQLPLSKLTYIVDIDEDKAKKFSALYHCSYTTNYKDIIDKIDAVTIAVPTMNHFQIAKDFLSAKKHVLLEKPITTTVDKAEILCNLAKKNNVIFQVGHIERFNPVVYSIKNYLKSIGYIEAERLNKFVPRAIDVDVILDLMIHDIDLVLYWMRAPVVSIDAIGVPVITDKIDIANCWIKFKNGKVANLSASRISLKPSRKIRIFSKNFYISLDLKNFNINFFEKTSNKIDSLEDIKFFKEKKIQFQKYEPLKKEIECFLDSIIQNKNLGVSAEEAKEALAIALEIKNICLKFKNHYNFNS